MWPPASKICKRNFPLPFLRNYLQHLCHFPADVALVDLSYTNPHKVTKREIDERVHVREMRQMANRMRMSGGELITHPSPFIPTHRNSFLVCFIYDLALNFFPSTLLCFYLELQFQLMEMQS